MEIEDRLCNESEGDMMLLKIKQIEEKEGYQGLETFGQRRKWRGKTFAILILYVHVKWKSVYDHVRNCCMLESKHLNKFIWFMLLWN